MLFIKYVMMLLIKNMIDMIISIILIVFLFLVIK